MDQENPPSSEGPSTEAPTLPATDGSALLPPFPGFKGLGIEKWCYEKAKAWYAENACSLQEDDRYIFVNNVHQLKIVPTKTKIYVHSLGRAIRARPSWGYLPLLHVLWDWESIKHSKEIEDMQGAYPEADLSNPVPNSDGPGLEVHGLSTDMDDDKSCIGLDDDYDNKDDDDYEDGDDAVSATSSTETTSSLDHEWDSAAKSAAEDENDDDDSRMTVDSGRTNMHTPLASTRPKRNSAIALDNINLNMNSHFDNVGGENTQKSTSTSSVLKRSQTPREMDVSEPLRKKNKTTSHDKPDWFEKRLSQIEGNSVPHNGEESTVEQVTLEAPKELAALQEQIAALQERVVCLHKQAEALKAETEKTHKKTLHRGLDILQAINHIPKLMENKKRDEGKHNRIIEKAIHQILQRASDTARMDRRDTDGLMAEMNKLAQELNEN